MPWFVLDASSYEFAAFAVPDFLTAGLILLLGFLVLIRERGSQASRLLFVINLTFAWYLFTFGFVYLAKGPAAALWWSRVSYVGVPFIPAAIYHFSSRVLRMYERNKPMVRIGWLLAAGFAVLISQTSLVVTHVEQFWFGWYPRYSLWSIPFVAFVAGMTMVGQFSYVRELRRSTPGTNQYHRLRAMMVAFGLGYIVMVDFLPKFGIGVYPFGFIPLLCFTGLTAWTVWRYRLVDITPAIAAPQVFETMTDVLVVLDRDGIIRLTNGAAERTFGGGLPLPGRPASAVLGGTFGDAHIAELLRSGALHGDELSVGSGEAERVFSLSASAMPGHGAPEGIVLVARDITERKRAEARLAYDAFHDSLTALANRALFLERLALAQQRTRGGREDYGYAVLFLDLDRFKTINDSLGHTAGDRLLQMVARRIELTLREGDSAARLSGDEFAILLEGVAAIRDVTRIADRLQADLAAPFELDGRRVFAAASIGIALSSSGYETPEDVLRDADIAMYRAKTGGKARYEIFDAEMHAQVMADLQIETDLRLAVERDEFEVHYQPIVSVRTQQITGFEALVRWRHPEHGLIKPVLFIPMAEETGLIVPIGQFVLREACRQLRIWQHAFPDRSLSMSINLSAKQFMQPDLVESVAAIIAETGADPRRVRLEVTESVLIENVELASRIFQRLKALGIRLSMDDFGTGFSSLSNLHRFQMDTLKIDRSFVAEMAGHDQNYEIVRTIIALARNLGMSVVAEGVETVGQLDQLETLSCDAVQGFFFSRPVDGMGASALIRLGLAVEQFVVAGDEEQGRRGATGQYAFAFKRRG